MATDPGSSETVGMATTTVERGHEERDASVRTILGVAAGLVGISAVITVAIYFHLEGLWRLRQRALPPASPVAAALPSAPPEPRLETAESLGLRDLRAAENAQLHGYGWVDRGAGIVHVPIDRAMDLVAQEVARPGPGAAQR